MAEGKRGPGRPKGSTNRSSSATQKRNTKEALKNTGAPFAEDEKEIAAKGFRQIIAAIVLLALGAFFVLSIHTDLTGAFGTVVERSLKGVFGLGAYILAYLLIIYGVLMLAGKTAVFKKSTAIVLAVLFLFLDMINACRFVSGQDMKISDMSAVYDAGTRLESGGVFGMFVDGKLYNIVGVAGVYLISVLGIAICLLFLLRTPVSRWIDKDSRESRSSDEDRKTPKKSVFSNPFGKKDKKETMILAVSEEDPRKDVIKRSLSDIEKEEKKKRKEEDRWMQKEQRAFEEDQWKSKPSSPSILKNAIDASTDKNHLQKENIIQLVQQEENLGKGGTATSYNETEYNATEYNPEPLERRKAADIAGKNISQKTATDPSLLFDEGEERQELYAAKGLTDGPTVGGASMATAASATESSEGEVSDTPKTRSRYKLPPVSLLNLPQRSGVGRESSKDLREKAMMLEQTLASFHVDANVVNIISGPSVTRYEIEPARGVKVQSITRLADDIALNMRAKSIRMEAPIPGKAAVGIEVENESRQMVGFREIVDSKEFKDHKSKMAFTVGRDIGGKPVVADLAKMPHMLIAGATGSGKSVCINTIICSILYKARPEEVRMILVDPKMVELGNYNGIPHLLIPVVTDATKATAALNWAVSEMTERYKKFAAAGVRKIAEYNKAMRQQKKKEEILPQIVIVIDELADLMMVASSQVEDAICRLAQLARAAGMHLVIATQRPSVDVITGLIKANVPSRIAFTVSSQIDSRTIIDTPGAEKLVGNGDMLFKPQDLNKPKRIQGPYIDDDEVERILEYVRGQAGTAEYSQEVIDHIEQGTSYQGDGNEEDELLNDAVDVVVHAGQASVSMLQRRFRVGYNRAARMVDAMEARGIIGPQDGSRPRQVLLTEQEWENRKGDF